MCGLKEQDAVWWSEGKKGEYKENWRVEGARQGDCSLMTDKRKESRTAKRGEEEGHPCLRPSSATKKREEAPSSMTML
eukprot:11285590-Prorocentrum_lima.AAC.1